MPIILRRKVGGIVFINVHVFRKTWVFSYCRTNKSNVLYA